MREKTDLDDRSGGKRWPVESSQSLSIRPETRRVRVSEGEIGKRPKTDAIRANSEPSEPIPTAEMLRLAGVLQGTVCLERKNEGLLG
jgi:hypothetical protein